VKELNVALIGYKFMGKAHSFAYANANIFFDLPFRFRRRVICGRSRAPLERAMKQFGWEECETDWRKVVSRSDIDLVDIASTPETHRDIAIAAAKEGKMVFCEKPLAAELKDARDMYDAVVRCGVKHAVCFNYRMLPAVCLAKQFISEGRIGAVRHMRAVYLQDWIVDPSFPLVWRLRKEVAGSGAHGDLNAHLIDLARYLIGEFSEVIGMSATFVDRRPLLKETALLETGLAASGSAEEFGEVTVDDATLFLARFSQGAVGSFEATRFAPGRRNGQRFEINGSRGSIWFDLERMNELNYFSLDDDPRCQGFRTILATDSCHPFAGNWWPAGHIIGYGESFVNMVAHIALALGRDENPSPDFSDGVSCQEVLEAVTTSVSARAWTAVRS